MKKEFSNQEYAEKVKKLTPKFSSFSNCWHAFVSGGAICVLGELIRQIAYNRVGKFIHCSKRLPCIDQCCVDGFSAL